MAVGIGFKRSSYFRTWPIRDAGDDPRDDLFRASPICWYCAIVMFSRAMLINVVRRDAGRCGAGVWVTVLEPVTTAAIRLFPFEMKKPGSC